MENDHDPGEQCQSSEHVPSEEKSFLSIEKSSFPKPRRSTIDAIGLTHLFTLFTSLFFLVGSLIFLCFLWRTSISVLSGNAAPALWQRLLDRNWIIRSVTISSVVIRMSVAVQVGLVTPMIASLLLEQVGTRIGGLPMLSILRCVSGLPHHLMRHIVRQIRGKTSLGLNALLLVVFLTSIVSQFTSTILLLDFGDRSIQSRTIFTNIQFGLDSSNGPTSGAFNIDDTDNRAGTIDPYSGVNYWKSGPHGFPRFAEWHQSASPEDGVADTGSTYRAFLPFASSEMRRSLRNYTGVATVLDFRTVCVRPKLNITGGWEVNEDLVALDGYAEWERHYPMLSHRPSSDPRTKQQTGFVTKTFFNCTIALESSRISSLGFWRTSLCRTNSDATWLKGPPDERGGDTRGIWTNSYILFNTTGSSAEWIDAGEFTDWDKTSTGSWTTLSAANPSSFSATMCFLNPNPANYEVDIWGSREALEPSLTWNHDSRAFNTEDIRNLYGAIDPLITREQRGILRLINHANWTAHLAYPKVNISTLDFVWSAIREGFDSNNADIPTDDGGALLTPWSDRVAQSIHRAHIAIFQDIIRSTHNPALALQTLFTILTQSAYYDFLPQFDVEAAAQYTVSVAASVPHQWTGFTIVFVVLSIHVLVVGVTTALFLAGTKVSMLGNAWQAIAQVVEFVEMEVLDDAREKRDKDITEILRASGRGHKVIKIS